MRKPVKLYSTVGMSHEDWLKHRKEGIGGSEASIVLGLNKWKTAYALWLEKTGQADAPDISNEDPVYFGTILEGVVAKEFEKRSGLKVQRRNVMYRHATFDCMIADVDRVIVGQNKGLECKTTSAYNADEWKDDNIPDAYYCQIQHYMAVMGWDSCYIACLIGGQQFVWKEVPRNNEFINELIKREEEFWKCVKQNKAPEITGKDDVSALFPNQELPDFLEATESARTLANDLLNAHQILATDEENVKRIENELKMLIGDSAGIKGLCTWKQNKDMVKTDWKAVAEELNPSADLVEKHTVTKKGARPFKLTLKETA